MSTLNLGKIRFNWTGAYNNSTAYVANDVVSSSGNSYICKLASTGNAVSNGTYWDLMSQAGTNGTDLTSTLTAQGDIVYRDGSGLQKLAKPASDKFLKNTSGGVVSWADAGGGAWEILTSVTPSNVASVDFTTSSWFPANQSSYALVFSDFRPVSDYSQLCIQVGTSSGFKTSGYRYHVGGCYEHAIGYYSTYSASASHMLIGCSQGNQPEEGYCSTVYLHGMNSSTNSVARVTGVYTSDNGNGYETMGHIGASISGYGPDNFNQFKVFYSSGNISSGRVTLYKINYA